MKNLKTLFCLVYDVGNIGKNPFDLVIFVKGSIESIIISAKPYCLFAFKGLSPNLTSSIK